MSIVPYVNDRQVVLYVSPHIVLRPKLTIYLDGIKNPLCSTIPSQNDLTSHRNEALISKNAHTATNPCLEMTS